MSESKKSIPSINERIKEGKAVVLTDSELRAAILSGHEPGVVDIDVVTTSWRESTRGTAAMLLVPVTKRGVFTRAKKIWLNGVLGFPGPAPNERLGQVDTLIFAGQPASDRREAYNGTKLFFDIIRKKEIQVECLSEEGDKYRSTFTIDQIQFARMYVYNCFFDGLPATAGNRQRNPERHFKTISTGSKVLLNKALGIVIGCGTRSSAERRSLSLAADMFEMDPDTMVSSENTSEIAIKNSIALAIPVLNEGIFRDLSAWLMARRPPSSDGKSDSNATPMADYLKEMIMKRAFFLTDAG